MGGFKLVFAPEKRLIASCQVRECGCKWLNLGFGCLRVWPLRLGCWGVWLPRRLAGLCLRCDRANYTEEAIDRIDIRS